MISVDAAYSILEVLYKERVGQFYHLFLSFLYLYFTTGDSVSVSLSLRIQVMCLSDTSGKKVTMLDGIHSEYTQMILM